MGRLCLNLLVQGIRFRIEGLRFELGFRVEGSMFAIGCPHSHFTIASPKP